MTSVLTTFRVKREVVFIPSRKSQEHNIRKIPEKRAQYFFKERSSKCGELHRIREKSYCCERDQKEW